MTTPASELASSRQLLRATIVAAAVAALILVTIVLPAEYGLDPTGAGRVLGVFRPAADVGAASELPETATVSSGSLLRSTAPFRSDEMSLTLRPGEGAEIKAAMKQGDRFVFSWTSTGAGVDVDMHGELFDANVEGRGVREGRGDGTLS
jgi:hypothetical protein